MVESKSGYFTNDFNAHSEKGAEFSPKGINRLADDSERTRRRRFVTSEAIPVHPHNFLRRLQPNMSAIEARAEDICSQQVFRILNPIETSAAPNGNAPRNQRARMVTPNRSASAAAGDGVRYDPNQMSCNDDDYGI